MKKMNNALIKTAFTILAFLAVMVGTVGNSLAVQADSPYVSEIQLTANDATANDNLGFSASISDDTAIVGAPFVNGYTGAAYVYVREGTNWVQQAKLVAGNGKAGDLFGWSVSIDGNVAVIGAQGKNSYRGRVYVFERSGSTWSQTAELDGNETMRYGESGAGDNPVFGCSVSVSGDTIVAGANNSNNAAGAAYVFVKSGSTWSQQAEILGVGTGVYAEYGSAVSVNGDTAVVVASGINTGAAYVFVRDGSTWTQQAYLSGIGQVNNGFGSVAVNGDTVLLGAFNGFNGPGKVFVFKRAGSTWAQEAPIVSDDRVFNDMFGCSISISGDKAVIGAFGTGTVYVFEYRDSVWTQQTKLTPGDNEIGIEFGYSVSMSGDTVLVGSPLINDKAGAAYVFRNSTPSIGATILASTFTEANKDSTSSFNWYVVVTTVVLIIVVGLLIARSKSK